MGEGRGREAESARADFNFRELPRYLSNTYKIFQVSLKFIGEQLSGNIFLSRVSLVAMAYKQLILHLRYISNLSYIQSHKKK